MHINISVNGQTKQVPAGQTVAALVDELALADRRIAVEVNQEIVPRSLYAEHALHAGDRVEVVTAIGGG
jgi:sulfur carrier protein